MPASEPDSSKPSTEPVEQPNGTPIWVPSADDPATPFTRRTPERFRKRDRLGRNQLRRLDMPFWLYMMATHAPSRVREVPSAAIEEEHRGEDGDWTLIACPCGGKPIAGPIIEKCAGCERHYTLAGHNVYVVYGAMEPPTPKLRAVGVD